MGVLHKWLSYQFPFSKAPYLLTGSQSAHNCWTYQNHAASVNAASEKDDPTAKGIDVNK
jgi:hypothetical protein